MKIILLLFFVLLTISGFSQVSSTKVVRIASDDVAFGQTLPEGTIVINLASDSLYLILTPVGATEKLSTLTRNTNYQSLVAVQDISGISTNATAISTNSDNISTNATAISDHETNDNDLSATNEIQTLDVAQLSGTKLQLSLSGDEEATHEIELSSLSGGGTASDDSTFVTVTTDTLFVAENISYVDSAHGVKINNNLTIEADGTLRVDNDATTWDDLRVTLDKGRDAAKFINAGIGGPEIWHFMDGSDDAMSFTVQLPHTWKEGSRIYPHIHWLTTSSAGGDVEWKFEYSWVNYNPSSPETFPPVSTLSSIGSAGSSSLAHQITSFSDGDPAGGIDGTGKKISSILICRILRDATAGNANDTYADDVGVLFFDIHIEINTMGSRKEFIK